MAKPSYPLTKPWRISFSGESYAKLHSHLFPRDGDEHGAVVLAGLSVHEEEVRLLVREVHLAKDGDDFVPGKRGYRMLRGEFITEKILRARDERLVYLAVHNHGGQNRVAFSSVDLKSHERAYPALLDVARGLPVGALVFAKNAIAGDIWVNRHSRIPIKNATIIGTNRQVLSPRATSDSPRISHQFDRQVRLFGEQGQHILRKAKVAIIGAGGAGSILVELVARLGVGHIVLVDPERAEPTNIPRLIGSTQRDAASWLLAPDKPKWIQSMGQRLAKRKVKLARRNIKRASPRTKVKLHISDFCRPNVVEDLKDCDYLFLAADTMRARLLFNALVHQYLIPGVQVGAKVLSEKATGRVTRVYAVTRPVTPDGGCLYCNQLINGAKLQEELLSEQERQDQRYIDSSEVAAPSVVTLNGLAAAQAANDFLFYMTGLMADRTPNDYFLFEPNKREVSWDKPRKETTCLHCGGSARSCFGKGDWAELPTVKAH